MCGIVGYVGKQQAYPILIKGLHRLEYRGYDSAGLALVNREGVLNVFKSKGKVADLEHFVESKDLDGTIGIAHTRWATHGEPNDINAHPHYSDSGNIALIHNGIIENYRVLKEALIENGYTFKSDTDTEVLVNLIEYIRTSNNCTLLEAVQQALKQVIGAYAIAVVEKGNQDQIIAARRSSPMVIGIGDKEFFLASDAASIVEYTDKIVYVNDGEVVVMDRNHPLKIVTLDNQESKIDIKKLQLSISQLEKGGYPHFMLKEIFEQPRAVGDTLEGVAAFSPTLFGAEAEGIFRNTQRLLFLACGTSYYSALTAKYWIEEIAGIPCDVEIASEYRYRVSVPDPRTLVVTISQSGETADTLAALRHARDELGMSQTLTICNVATSAMVNESRLAYITRAGVEIGVASTKAFTTQLTALYLLACTLAKLNGRLTKEDEETELKRLRHLPAAMSAVLALEPQIIAWAERFAAKQHALFLGRGVHYPIALEGALKLKEISYIHAEAYPAGELKHGPLALVDREMPVVTVAPNDRLLEKLKSNMQEVRARGGELYVCADGDSVIESSEGMHVIRMPENYGRLSPILHVVPLQLLAYHTALARGTDVDKPRNLAKSVTVE